MINLQTITTIELSNDCNLSCRYCIQDKLQKHPAREVGFMSDEVFNQTLDVLKELVDMGTQKEVNMNGNGEALLDPKFCERASAVKDVIGDQKVLVCTNGVNMSEPLARDLMACGIDKVDLSPHSVYHVRRTLSMWHKMNFNKNGVLNLGAFQMSHNWAGQLNVADAIDISFKIECSPLIEGRGYVQKEGTITPCCFDYQNLGVYAHVSDPDVLTLPMHPYPLCKSCHQVIPEWVWAVAGMTEGAVA